MRAARDVYYRAPNPAPSLRREEAPMKMSRFVVTALLAAAGCGGADSTAYDTASITSRFGIDYAWGRPAPSTIRADGYTFAARYLSYSDGGKNLSAGEAASLRSGGVDVAVVWEESATAALNGYSEGVSDARAAQSEAAACGQPAGRPIYFAVDFDASAGDQAAINSYLDGVASVIGRERTGVYGGYYVVKRSFDAGKVRYGWQTYAWSGGQWDGRAQLRQILNGISVGGVDSDRDQAVAADFGQWGYAAPPPRQDPRIAVGTNADGRLEVMYVGTNDAVGHIWEKVGGGWSGLTNLGGDAKTIAVARNADGRLEIFYVGTNDKLYHNFQKAPGTVWYGEVPLGGSAKQIAIGHHPDGRIEVFYIGTNDKLYHNWQTQPNGDWSGETALGGAAKQIAVAENADGRIEIFYVGTDDKLYHNFQTAPNAGWYGQVPFGGSGKQIAVGHHPDGRIEVFYIGTNDKLFHNWQTQTNGNWSGELALGGAAKQIAVGENEDGRIEIFYVGTDDAIYHNFQTAPDAGWNGQMRLAGEAKQLTVGRNSDGRLEIFYIGTNDALYHNWQTAPDGAWHGQSAL